MDSRRGDLLPPASAPHKARLGHARLGGAGSSKKIEQQAFETIAFCGAGLIVAYPRSWAAGVDRAVTNALENAVGEADGEKVAALKHALLSAREEMKQPAQ